MTTRSMDVQQAQATLKELLSVISAGDEIVLMEGNTPVARLVPVAQAAKARKANLHPGAVWVSPDFTDPLADEFGSTK